MLTYREFVAAIRELIPEGERLRGAAERHLDPRFRQWRLKLEDLLTQIEAAGYDVNCRSRTRSYGAHHGYNVPTRDILNRLYRQELEDTLNELRLLVENYDKYGARQPATKPEAKWEAAQVPTIRQFFLALQVHQGWRALVALGGALLAVLYLAFLAGLYFERYIWPGQERTRPPAELKAPGTQLP